jgi:hypothetical protein
LPICKLFRALKPTFYPLLVRLLICFVLLGTTANVHAQDNRIPAAPSTPADTIRPALEPVPGLAPASNTTTDTIAVNRQATGDIKTSIKYDAEDSIRFDVENHTVYLYGDAKIDYGDIALTAEYIIINWTTSTLTARGGLDSLGKKKGTPVFKQGAETFVVEHIKYNFKTRKALISGVVTQQGEGYLHGETIKKNENDELFVRHAQYTTCNLEHPHFYIRANKIKVIPDDKLISGPFNLVISDVPTPLGFAFGMFPTPRKQSSGIVMPAYGEALDRGFFLRNGGYYWAVNDYLGINVLGDIYSRGGYGLSSMINYRSRYKYDGRFNVRYNRQVRGDEITANRAVDSNFWVDWSHTPQTKGTSRFSTSVSAGTSRFNQLNSWDAQNYLSNTFRSNVSWSKTFTGTPFNLSANLRQDQNTRTGEMNFILPDVNFAMNRIYPFKKADAPANTWYQNINIAYNFNASNRISNAAVQPPAFSNNPSAERVASRADSVLPFTMANLPDILQRTQVGGRHSIPITTSVTLFKFFNLNPSVNYEEFWYLRRQVYTGWTPETPQVQAEMINGFSRAYSFNTNAGLTTRLYGTYFIKGKNVEAVRHVMTPTINFNYRPDFSDPRFGIYQEVRVDEIGNTQRFSPFQNSMFGGPASGRSGGIGLLLNNNVEMKVRSKGDTAAKFTKVSLLDDFGISTNYNFLADSNNLSDINLTARTRILNSIDIMVNAIMDPYGYRLENRNQDGRPVQYRQTSFAVARGEGLATLTSANFSLSTNFNPDALKRKSAPRQRPPLDNVGEEQLRQINMNPDMYVDFNIPWSLFVSYNFNYTRRGYEEANVVQSLSFNGDISLTEKWKISGSSAFDFEARNFSFTTLNIHRDLHCWDMRFSWIPFGPRQSYTFDINVKASILQDLKLSRRRHWFDR